MFVSMPLMSVDPSTIVSPVISAPTIPLNVSHTFCTDGHSYNRCLASCVSAAQYIQELY